MTSQRSAGPGDGDVPPEIDTSTPHPARVYDYFLGGKDNFVADRETGMKSLKAWPGIRTAARENRAFLGRAGRYVDNDPTVPPRCTVSITRAAYAPSGGPRTNSRT